MDSWLFDNWLFAQAEHVLSLAVQTLREELASLLTAYAEMEAERVVAHA